jgi:hypothetical protein
MENVMQLQLMREDLEWAQYDTANERNWLDLSSVDGLRYLRNRELEYRRNALGSKVEHILAYRKHMVYASMYRWLRVSIVNGKLYGEHSDNHMRAFGKFLRFAQLVWFDQVGMNTSPQYCVVYNYGMQRYIIPNSTTTIPLFGSDGELDMRKNNRGVYTFVVSQNGHHVLIAPQDFLHTDFSDYNLTLIDRSIQLIKTCMMIGGHR